MLTLLTNADLYTPAPRGLGCILIAGEKIIFLGSEVPEFQALPEISVVDLDGAMVTPGIIDGHAHITGGGGETGPSSRVPPWCCRPSPALASRLQSGFLAQMT